MEFSKIHLSSAEMELMQNAKIILTKNSVLEKVKLLLQDVQDRQMAFINTSQLTNDIFKVSPKISRGENYLGLPYLILDYPRQSSVTNFFFIRTMFWWGKFFSCTLHLAKDSKTIFQEKIISSRPQLSHFYLATSDDQWAHHLEETDYRKIILIEPKELKKICEDLNHIKIVGQHSLAEWENAPDLLLENWKFFLNVCGLIS